MQHPISAGSSPPASDTGTSGADPNREYRVNGIRIPGKLLYSRNHMWMDESEDGLFHVGVDAFMTKVLGPVEKISFLTTKGIERPTAVLTVNGVDMEVVFPAQILITGLNCYLRSTPEKLSADPYGAGWLFEGQKPKHPGNDDPLLQGTKAVDWMKRESDRLLQFVHNHLQETKLEGKILMADGGTCVDGLARHLHRDDLLKLFHNFFSPYVSWRN